MPCDVDVVFVVVLVGRVVDTAVSMITALVVGNSVGSCCGNDISVLVWTTDVPGGVTFVVERIVDVTCPSAFVGMVDGANSVPVVVPV